ncbi:SMC family ATPase [Parahaliea sp. F7430]|uniref:SMC family ATPase n=1 Tax=Sediminihaliea albiluteola TaxID=2758564 RepID=A0A7W2YIM9_9GAMM|nr:SMC family ATPase [Sediminihaliea albiluteola]MBA6412222.1 SMC family ATPase [Sediminihaliea albiluteola]
MRPLTLRMQAFGPFAATEEINFADLGNAPLFLINGPTGSGKTTILDAICYALYGSTTGAEREAAQMRCQHSPPELLTEVSLSFALGRHRYQITRSPDQLRPKQRGEGLTEHKSRAELYRLGEDGSTESGSLLVEQKVLDANRYIKDIIGMSAEQFRQVMVLPQGQFRKLLLASSQERESIFQSLFQTGIYKRIEERLKQSAASIRRDHEDGLTLLRGILSSGEVEDEKSLLAELQQRQQDLSLAEQDYQSLYQQWQQAERQLTKAKQLEATLARLKTAQQSRDQLESQAASVQQQRQQVKLAQAAQLIEPVLLRLQESTEALTKAEQKLSTARAELASAKQTKSNAAELLAAEQARQPEREALKSTLNDLRRYVPRLEVLQAAREALRAQQEALDTCQREQRRAQQQLDSLRDEELAVLAEIENLRGKVERATGLELQIARCKQAVEQAQALERLQAQLQSLQQQLIKSEQQKQQQHAQVEEEDRKLRQLRRAWHLGQARVLADSLQEGQPCPVCGSESHPAPATETGDKGQSDWLETPDEEILEAQERCLQSAQQKLSECERELASLGSQQQAQEQQQQQLLDKFDGQAAPESESLRAELKALQQDLRQREQHSQLLAAAEQRQKSLKQALSEAEQALGNNATKESEARVALTQKSSQVAHLEDELPEDYREQGQLAAALKESEARLQAMESAWQKAETDFAEADRKQEGAQATEKALSQTLQQQRERQQGSQEGFKQALAESPFASEQERSAAAMERQELEKLQRKVEDYDAAVSQIRTTVETLEQETQGRELADVQVLSGAELSAREQRDAAQLALQNQRQRLNTLESTQAKLQAQRKANQALEQRYQVVGTLADVATGSTGAKISLQRYVLGVLLDDVLVQASLRLSKMSGGRYQLIRKLDANKGRRAAGLDLEVHDDFSGSARPVATLSGGESFMAALSLALGLSDVVQSQTGGIALDTLFVDEGFGSLDSEALELAINTLMELQKAGRMVGIISHVSELKEQMDLRIDLQGGREGSSLRIVSPFK